MSLIWGGSTFYVGTKSDFIYTNKGSTSSYRLTLPALNIGEAACYKSTSTNNFTIVVPSGGTYSVAYRLLSSTYIGYVPQYIYPNRYFEAVSYNASISARVRIYYNFPQYEQQIIDSAQNYTGGTITVNNESDIYLAVFYMRIS